MTLHLVFSRRKIESVQIPNLSDGFRVDPNGPGLYLPETESRLREVWTKADWKKLNSAQKVCQRSGLSLILRCEHPACQEAPLTKIRTADGFLLRCGHADRVFTKGF